LVINESNGNFLAIKSSTSLGTESLLLKPEKKIMQLSAFCHWKVGELNRSLSNKIKNYKKTEWGAEWVVREGVGAGLKLMKQQQQQKKMTFHKLLLLMSVSDRVL
jgi:hypothetical protein